MPQKGARLTAEGSSCEERRPAGPQPPRLQAGACPPEDTGRPRRGRPSFSLGVQGLARSLEGGFPPSKKAQPWEEDECHMISLICGIQKQKTTRTYSQTKTDSQTQTDGWIPKGKLGRDKLGAGINRDTLLKGESSLEACTWPQGKDTASGNLLQDAGSSNLCSVTTEGRDGWRVGGRFQREGTCVYLRLIRVDACQKPAQYCTAIILWLKINNFKKKERRQVAANVTVPCPRSLSHRRVGRIPHSAKP